MVLVAATALLGWCLGREALTSIVSGWATMKPNTAFALAALGLGLCSERLRASGAWFAALLASVALLEWGGVLDTRLDELFFADEASVALGEPPGRMAAATALGVVLGALSLATCSVPRRAALSQSAAAAALGVSWVALLGYAYELGPLTTVWLYGTVSLPTGVALAGVGLGALFLRPTEGWVGSITSRDSGAALLRRLGPAALVVPALTAWLGLRFQQRYALQPGFALAAGATLDAVVFAAILYTTASATRAVDAARERTELRLREVSTLRLEAHESERRRIALELHDDVGQALTALRLLIARAPRDPAAADEASEIVGALGDSIRGIALDLRPAMLDDLGLVPTLSWLVDRWSGQTRIPVTPQLVGGARRYPPAVETAAYRIVQEALTNVARHARASAVRLRVALDDEHVEVRIIDDGVGFDVNGTDRRASLGLAGMEDRARSLGGVFRVVSHPGCTTIHALLPAGQPT